MSSASMLSSVLPSASSLPPDHAPVAERDSCFLFSCFSCLKEIFTSLIQRIMNCFTLEAAASVRQNRPTRISTNIVERELVDQDIDYAKPVDYSTFQLDCNGGEIPFYNRFTHFKGPVISRYDTEGNHYAKLHVRLKLTPEMAQRLPGFFDEVEGRTVSDAYLTIWSETPPERPGSAPLQFSSLLFKDLDSEQGQTSADADGGRELVKLGYVTDHQKGGVEQLRPREFDYQAVKEQSQMGTFAIYSFTAVAERSTQGHEGEVLAFYTLMINHKALAKEVAKVATEANNLEELLRGFREVAGHSQGPVQEELLRQVGVIDRCLG